MSAAPPTEAAPRELELAEEEVFEEFVRRGWCDGLPIVPPTPERVAAMVAAGGVDPVKSFGVMPPLWRECTVEKIAINAVMAGCVPAHFPVLLAAVQALLDTADDVWGTADMVLKVKEPIAEEYARMREGQTLFTYLHLAADKPLTEELLARKVTAIASSRPFTVAHGIAISTSQPASLSSRLVGVPRKLIALSRSAFHETSPG